MSFIKSINAENIKQLIASKNERIILSQPGLFIELVKAIVEKYCTTFKKIRILLNCSEKIIRQGYGEIETIIE